MKYKHAESDGWYYQIDENGLKSQSWNKKNRPAMYQQMEEWEAEGNTIEPRYTAGEKAIKDAKEAAQALESQFSTCKQLLDKTQYIVSGDCDFPQADIDKYLVWRVEIKTIMRSGEVLEVPEKPF